MNRLEIKRAIRVAGHNFHEQMYAAHDELGNIAGEFMNLNMEYVLLHKDAEETYKTLHILQTGFSKNQKKYLERLSKQSQEDTMINQIGQFETRILRDAMHIAAQFSDRAIMYITATNIQIRAKNVWNSGAVWIDIPTSVFRPEYSSEDPMFATDVGIDCEKLYRLLDAYEEDAKIRFGLEHRECVGELVTISGTEGTLWTYQTSLDHISTIPGRHTIRSARPLPASGDKDAEIFRDWLHRIDCEDDALKVSFVHDNGHERCTLWAVPEESGGGCVLGNPSVPASTDNLRTAISLELLQRSLAPKCIDEPIKFSFGNDTTLFMETQVNGCDVAMAIAPRMEGAD